MGYQELRAKRQEAILAFMRGREVFVTLPTGCGKSLCCSILPGAFDSCLLCIKAFSNFSMLSMFLTHGLQRKVHA